MLPPYGTRAFSHVADERKRIKEIQESPVDALRLELAQRGLY